MTSLPLPPAASATPADLRATAQWMTLEPGLYTLRVTGGASDVGGAGLPFVQIAEAPGNPPAASVVILGATPSSGGTLARLGDALALRVSGSAARLVLTSYTAATAQGGGLAVEVARLGGTGAGTPLALPGTRAGRPMQRVIPIEVVAHVQNHGDLRFAEGGWAGHPEQRHWIEAFAVAPQEGLTPADLEYKALTATGWETPWIEGGTLCGTRGMGIPLLGFAVRLRGAAAAGFECVYEGQFVSGARVGPVSNGALCRSDVVSDPLDGLLIRVVTKPASSGAEWR